MTAVPAATMPAIPGVPTLPRVPLGRSRSRAPRAAPAPLRAPSPLAFPAAPAIFPWLARRFAPGEATLWVGPSRETEALLELLYGGVVAAGGRLSLLEGANRFHPYRIAERARSFGAEPGDALERIRLARAFTGYQMVALVDRWPREVRAHAPSLLVAHDVPALFFASEFPQEERGPLLAHVARCLAKLARATRLPLLLTAPGGLDGFPGLADEGPRLFDLVRLRPGPAGLRLEAYRESTRMDLVRRPDGQRGLEEFDGGPEGEVTAWAGRSRRTAKRSRSG